VHPVRRASLNAQYGLRDDSERRELDARWRDHFALHPGEYTLFKRLVAEYQDWLIRQPE
jgi:hypothetical protein